MFTRNRSLAVVLFSVIVLAALAACTEPTPEVVVQEVKVTELVVVTSTPELPESTATRAPEPTAVPPSATPEPPAPTLTSEPEPTVTEEQASAEESPVDLAGLGLTLGDIERLRPCGPESTQYDVHGPAVEEYATAWINAGLIPGATEIVGCLISEWYLGTRENDGAMITQEILRFNDITSADNWMQMWRSDQVLSMLWGESEFSREELPAPVLGDDCLLYDYNQGVYMIVFRRANIVVWLVASTQDQRDCGLEPGPDLLESLARMVDGRFSSTPPSENLGFVEEFEQPDIFTQTSENVYISNGQVVWNFSRSGGEQYVYRSISRFDGDVRLIVRGRINDWTNNCGITAGIGDEPGSGVAVFFGFYGGGCSTSGPVVNAGGVRLEMQESSCSFSGTWPWVEAQRDYDVELIVEGSDARLVVPNVATVEGTRNYDGEYTTLWVGGYGGGDWPTCSGTIESVTVEPLP